MGKSCCWWEAFGKQIHYVVFLMRMQWSIEYTDLEKWLRKCVVLWNVNNNCSVIIRDFVFDNFSGSIDIPPIPEEDMEEPHEDTSASSNSKQTAESEYWHGDLWN